MQGKARWIAAAAIAALALAAVGWFAWPTDARERSGALASGDSESSAESGRAPFSGPAGSTEPLPTENEALIEQLRAKFGPHIGNKHAQIKLIEQLMRYLSERYPEDWRARLRTLLQQIFPELAAELYARFEKLEGHNRWLEENRRSLNAMPAAQRRELLWAARYQAFGAEAEEIWAGARRAEKLQDSLAALDVADGTPAPQKFERFLGTVKQAYGEQAEAFIGQRQTELLGNFLAVNAVQTELRAMAPAQRSAALREIRATAGMDNAALTRWDELDRSRDQAWDAGQRYMNERAAILAVGAPEQQAQQLQQLRESRFGLEEAAIIASEEETGFFRFGGERRIGRE